tara:strand:+ start:31342 stop:33039 length:1698 start_codon:yes stop_codon:yes gene_type:complete
MLDFKHIYEPEDYIETSIAGKLLLMTPQLNKSTAFSKQERHDFDLLGKLPPRVEDLEEQVQRAYLQFSSFETFLEKNIYLNNLHNTNQVLFYRLVTEHLKEMVPTIYTPIVGTAVKSFSREYRSARGLFVAYNEAQHIEEILDNRSNPDIDVIVVTDGEGVLGIGDQGVGGMDIPIAKLMVYGLCGGINPCHTLPIQLDVGTNNQALLDDPMYLGLRHPRKTGKEYDDFIAKFVAAIKKKFPHVFLHWEDFGRGNARRILDEYRDQLCTFNDDVQGTGAVTLAGFLAAVKYKGEKLSDQRIVVYGAGTAGMGITDQIRDAMIREGLTEEQANAQFWLVDRFGLIFDDMDDLTDAQKPYALSRDAVKDWKIADASNVSLAETTAQVHPTILVGCSAQAGHFTEDMIKDIAKHTDRPIILPLSNPTEKAEATPTQILEWTDGKALIATGSPFEPVDYKGHTHVIAQCNNALVFPGLGLGMIASKSKRCTDNMIWAACDTLSDHAPINNDPHAALLPDLDHAREVAEKIGIAVAKQAQKDGFAQVDGDPETLVKQTMWKPHYVPLKRK